MNAGGVQVGVPGQNGGQVEIAVGQPETPAKTEGTTGGGATNPPAKTGGEETKPAGGETNPPAEAKASGTIGDVAGAVVEAPIGGVTAVASGVAGG